MSKYKENVARVSDIVSFAFPFEGFAKDNYINSLQKIGVEEKSYMSIAQQHGTHIHTYMEEYITSGLIDKNNEIYKFHSNRIEGGLKYIDLLKENFPGTEWISEYYMCEINNKFQGTADLVRINGNRVFIYDWKTFGLSKEYHGGIEKTKKDGTPLKPTSRLKKVSLQLSLYRYILSQQGYEIGGIYLVRLHNSGRHEYKATLWEKEQLEEMIEQFLKEKALKENKEEFIIF